MARSISSRKALRQSQRRAERNKARRTVIKTAIRKVSDTIAAKDAGSAEKALRETVAILDRSANRKTLHRNTAARRKSLLARRVNAIKGHSGK